MLNNKIRGIHYGFVSKRPMVQGKWTFEVKAGKMECLAYGDTGLETFLFLL